MKTISNALLTRRRIFGAFEVAESAPGDGDHEYRQLESSPTQISDPG
jgi:hypothetical protein